MKGAYIDHATAQHDTIAKIVGVNRGESRFNRPVPPKTVAAFFGCEHQHVEDPFAPRATCEGEQKKGQDVEKAINVFYGVEEKKTGLQLGQPIPGYSGVSRRVEADNMFGMTYAETYRRAKESQSRIQQEKGETLKTTAVFKR